MRHRVVLVGKDYWLYNDDGMVIFFGKGDKRCLANFGKGKHGRLQAGAYIAGILKGLELREEAEGNVSET